MAESLFTPAAAVVFRQAQEQALRLGHSYVGSEHLLLGLARQERTPAGQLLQSRGLGPAVLQKTIAEVSEMSGYEISEKQARDYLIYDIDLKTEIHPLATLNDEFIGCIHKQLPDRQMIFSPEETSLGCIPQDKMQGVLKITLLVFNVAKDDTHYTLTVSAE